MENKIIIELGPQSMAAIEKLTAALTASSVSSAPVAKKAEKNEKPEAAKSEEKPAEKTEAAKSESAANASFSQVKELAMKLKEAGRVDVMVNQYTSLGYAKLANVADSQEHLNLLFEKYTELLEDSGNDEGL